MNPSEKIILALDTPNADSAHQLLESLGNLVQHIKIGPTLFLQEGPAFIRDLQKKGYRIFLDLKLHDIPNTVALGVKAARQLGVWMFSIHLSGGKAMLEQAVQAAGDSLTLVGITVLTSLDGAALSTLGVQDSPENQVKRLAALGKSAGVKGIVSSPQEVAMLRALLGNEMLLVTPGIRATPGKTDDQTRTLTAAEAIAAGSDYLVVGRPVLQAPNPREALEAILQSIGK